MVLMPRATEAIPAVAFCSNSPTKSTVLLRTGPAIMSCLPTKYSKYNLSRNIAKITPVDCCVMVQKQRIKMNLQSSSLARCRKMIRLLHAHPSSGRLGECMETEHWHWGNKRAQCDVTKQSETGPVQQRSNCGRLRSTSVALLVLRYFAAAW